MRKTGLGYTGQGHLGNAQQIQQEFGPCAVRASPPPASRVSVTVRTGRLNSGCRREENLGFTFRFPASKCEFRFPDSQSAAQKYLGKGSHTFLFPIQTAFADVRQSRVVFFLHSFIPLDKCIMVNV